MKNLCLLLFFVVFSSAIIAQNTGKSLWSEQSPAAIRNIKDGKVITVKEYSLFQLNVNDFRVLAAEFPHENSVQNGAAAPYILELPAPDGSFWKFAVVESPVMEDGLAEQYPMIKTYYGQGIENNVSVIRFDVTPQGFHAQVLSPEGSWYIDPYAMSTTEYYMSYFKKNLLVSAEKSAAATCAVEIDPDIAEEITFLREQFDWVASGEQLRTYRTAIAATGEYTTFHGGTVELGLAAIVTALNRVTGIYELEVAVRMILIANNNLIVYTNASTDPYTNNNGSTMLTQNVNNLNTVIGNANFDVGHVFSTGGGGIAGLGVICGNSKARGVTGLPSPIGDPFYVDYVAHEMGHQFGGNHTFNGSSGSCSGGNRNASTAYEPGSGTTIMAYAGICSGQNTQNFSDPYFHGLSLDEIIAFTTAGGGNNCPVTTATNNLAPVVSVPAGGFTIPKSTPFALTGSATDGNNDTLSYCWEQFDLGAAGSPNAPVGNAPIFRSFNPVMTPTRYFPKLSNVINNTQIMGEILPSYARTLTFRLTARDNKALAGGTGKATIQFSVTDAAGPFLVTFPNTAMSLDGSTTQTITWDVANTSASPVNCQNVKISLSTDGGLTFPTVILASTPNDGAEQITLPNLPTTTARIKIEAVGNIFYDMSNANFTIVDNPVPVEMVSFKANTSGNIVTLEWTTATEVNNAGFAVERSEDNISFSKVGFVQGKGTTQEYQNYFYSDNVSGAGKYYYRLRQTDFDGTEDISVVVEAEISTPDEYVLAQNYPNPFNPSTTISFALPQSSAIILTLYNAAGETVREIAKGQYEAGYHSLVVNASDLSSGVYTYSMKASSSDGKVFSSVKKLVLMK